MTKEEKVLFGDRLRRVRLQANLTQDAAAESLNISLRYYQMLERGENTGSVDLLISLCDLLNCSLDYLLRGSMVSLDHGISRRVSELSGKQRRNFEKMVELWLSSIESSN